MGSLPSISSVGDLGAYLVSKVAATVPEKELAFRYGYREYMIPRYREILGSLEEVEELLRAFEKPLKPSIRCNTLKVKDCNYLVRRLRELGFTLKAIGWEPTSFQVVRGGRVSAGATHEFLLGLYYLYRGSASLLPPLLLSPAPRDFVLDIAAAPGGKTTHIAQLMGNRGAIVAVDVSRERMRALRTNIERMGVRNVVALRLDGRLVPKIFPDSFSKAILDAPCSAEGLIQVDRSRKTRTSIKDLVRLHSTQVELLNAALNSIKGSGIVLYTTCSIAPEENELVVARVIELREDVDVVRAPNIVDFTPGITEYFGIKLPEEVSKCVRVFPHIHGMEGFFICMLRKV